MDNYWYYTLSAIPQTLATMIALTATFVVFKLNFLSEQIQKSRNDLARFILVLTSYKKREIQDIEPLSHEEFIELYEEGLKNIKSDESDLGLEHGIYLRLMAEMQRIIKEEWRSRFKARRFRIDAYLKMKRDFFNSLLSIKKTSLRLLSSSLLLTTFMIVVSLFVLPNYGLFYKPYLIVVIIMLGSLFSVCLTAYSVWKIAKLGKP